VRRNDIAFLTTVELLDIHNPYFDLKESYYCLYYYSKIALTMRLSIGFDYLIDDLSLN
jgi:hypothetical protein